MGSPWRQRLVTFGVFGLVLLFLISMFFSTPGTFSSRDNGDNNRTSSTSSTNTSATSTAPSEPQFVVEGQLAFVRNDSILTELEIEIVDTPDQIEQGVMFRRSMLPNRGMLFIFPEERPRSFWMKNCYFPLDMIFVGSNRQIVSIQRNTVPFSEASVPSGVPAQYVVEVNGGFAEAYGLQVGDLISF